jgi:formamidopyrimidine-DNA glycosylase
VPELPDITVYVESLAAKLHGDTLERVRVPDPFVLRTAVPPIWLADGRRVLGVERLGKRVVLELQGDGGRSLFVVIHLMVAGRLRWLAAGAKPPARGALASFAFGTGTLMLTEAGTKRRASIHLLDGRDALAAMDPGGIDVFAADAAAFAGKLAAENHTLKRSLTNPRLFSGIGNAYADEILHRAKLSPITLTRKLTSDDAQRLHAAVREVLGEWIERLRGEATRNGGWPDKVTAFRPEMAVHGKYRQPCPVCGAPVQRIVHGGHAPRRPAVAAPRWGAGDLEAAQRSPTETNYCARCQTGGRLLADRALSTLLKASWPRHIDDIE